MLVLAMAAAPTMLLANTNIELFFAFSLSIPNTLMSQITCLNPATPRYTNGKLNIAFAGNTSKGNCDLNSSTVSGTASGPPTHAITPPTPTAPDNTHPVTLLVIEDNATIGNL